MADNITNKDYITITDTKVMVGGKETTTYRGCDIWRVKELPSLFKDIQAKVKQEYGSAPTEMHTLSSGTVGQYAKPGAPSAEPGENAWVRFMFVNGPQTLWLFRGSFSSASVCAYHCGYYVLFVSTFRSGLFGPIADAIKPPVQVKPKIVGQSGDMTTMEIDFDNKRLQFQINVSSLLKSNGK